MIAGVSDAISYPEALARIREIAAAGELEFVARVNTVWTMLGLEIWLSRRARHGVRGRGVVVAMPSTLTDPVVIPDATRRALAAHGDVELFRIAPFGDGAAYRRLNLDRARRLASVRAAVRRRMGERPLPLVSPRHRDLGMLLDLDPRTVADRSVRFEILDEGFGGAPAVGWQSTEYQAHRALRGLFLAGAETIRHELVRRGGGSTTLDDDLARAYRAAVERHTQAVRFDRPPGPCAMLVTSYLSEFGWMTREDELSLCDRVVSRLDRLGYAILLKQHPREVPDKFRALPAVERARDLRHLPKDVAAEAFLPSLGPGDAVVGLMSNVHFSARLLYGLDAYLLRGSAWGAPANDRSDRAYARLFPGGLPDFAELPRAPGAAVPEERAS